MAETNNKVQGESPLDSSSLSGGGFLLNDGGNIHTRIITWATVRPNLCTYNDWFKVEELRGKLAARLLRIVLDSVLLMPLAHKHPLYRTILSFYNRMIEPSHKSGYKAHQCAALNQTLNP